MRYYSEEALDELREEARMEAAWEAQAQLIEGAAEIMDQIMEEIFEEESRIGSFDEVTDELSGHIEDFYSLIMRVPSNKKEIQRIYDSIAERQQEAIEEEIAISKAAPLYIVATCKSCKLREKQVDTQEQADSYICISCRKKK